MVGSLSNACLDDIQNQLWYTHTRCSQWEIKIGIINLSYIRKVQLIAYIFRTQLTTDWFTDSNYITSLELKWKWIQWSEINNVTESCALHVQLTHPNVTTKFTVGQPITKAFSGQMPAIATSLTFSEIHTSAIGTQCFSLKLRFCLDFPGFPTIRRSSKRNMYRRLLSELGCSRSTKVGLKQ